ncbi:MAG: class I SAM-dependent methyltransferase, partial [Myxococcales bacterium]|nr:class I SAM-dependent methyltransferase [Myxococcales bacterium]
GEIARCAPRGIRSLDPLVRVDLALAAYQLFFTRVPAFAAVSEAVDAVRRRRGPRLASFANAVLRRVAEAAAGAPDARGADDLRTVAVVASAPAWLREALARALPEGAAVAYLRAGTEPPPIGLRIEAAGERDAWVERLRAAAPGASFEPGRVSARAILARGAGKPQALPGWQEGAWSVQEEGSLFAAAALGAREGERVLDACAGRGNKTAVLARAVGRSGGVVACDIHASKLERLDVELARLGLELRAKHAVDWSVGSGDVTGTFDRVLVDAPCSGIGTLRRRPEIALRRAPADLRVLAEKQLAIAAGAAAHLRPGGVLGYVVCSVLRDEAEEVVDALVRRRPELAPEPFDAEEVRALWGEVSSFRLLPHVHGTDGYFVARLRSRGPAAGGDAIAVPSDVAIR